MTADLVSVHGLRAGYVSNHDAIRDIEFGVGPGRLVAILGPNGGGKTTLFRALLGELPHSSGKLEVRGRIAYVAQTERARLDFPVSTRDVALMGTYAGASWFRRLGPERGRRADAALERVGLERRARVPFGELSGGERQRALIARALAQDAQILLLDEPLSGLDAPSSDRVLALLADLRSSGHLLLVATHDIQQARDFDLVLCLNGEQIAWGIPQEALTAATLERTYGGELIRFGDGGQAVVVQHHSH